MGFFILHCFVAMNLGLAFRRIMTLCKMQWVIVYLKWFYLSNVRDCPSFIIFCSPAQKNQKQPPTKNWKKNLPPPLSLNSSTTSQESLHQLGVAANEGWQRRNRCGDTWQPFRSSNLSSFSTERSNARSVISRSNTLEWIGLNSLNNAECV